MEQTGVDPSQLFQTAPTYNMADVTTAFRNLGGSAGSGISLDNLVHILAVPVGEFSRQEVITQTISLVNPNGIDVTSNLEGTLVISPSLQDNLLRAGATPQQINENSQCSDNNGLQPVWCANRLNPSA